MKDSGSSTSPSADAVMKKFGEEGILQQNNFTQICIRPAANFRQRIRIDIQQMKIRRESCGGIGRNADSNGRVRRRWKRSDKSHRRRFAFGKRRRQIRRFKFNEQICSHLQNQRLRQRIFAGFNNLQGDCRIAIRQQSSVCNIQKQIQSAFAFRRIGSATQNTLFRYLPADSDAPPKSKWRR